jgi:NAD(P)H-nitrite reductase large subunit
MKIIIIGNGIAGNSAAETVRVVNPEAEITLVSEEPYPEYSACVLCDYIAGELPRQRVFLKKKKDYEGIGVKTLLLGRRVEAIDPIKKRVVIEGENYSYDKLILATGSEPLVPPIPGLRKKGIFPLKSLSDAMAISRHKGKKAVVIGSGPIGIEATIALKKKGYEIHLVELLGWVLPRLLDEESSRMTAEVLHRNGVDVIVGEKVNEIHGQRKVEGISTDCRQITCDTVILSAGVKARVELAKKGGIGLGRFGGIKVNLRMETDQPDIYACGDCVEAVLPGIDETVLSQLWLTARQQGEIAGSNAAGRAREYTLPMNVISLRVFDTYVASVSHPKYYTNQKYEKIEKKFKDVYCRMALENGILKSIQSLGKLDEMGIFASFIKREVKIDRMKELAGLGQGSSLFPLYEKIRYYLS